MRLSGKTALVTGAASGIGAACATLFNTEGARVAGVDVNTDGLEALGDALDFAQSLDVRDKAAVDALVESVASAFGRIDILVNCAGITARHVPENTSWEDAWQQVMDVNVKGTLLITTAVMAIQRRDATGGAIVNMSSIYGQVARPPIITSPTDPYPHSKATVLQMTRDLAVSGAPDGIRVNALCPGFINTPLTAGLRENAELHAALISMHPVGRLGTPEEVARCALFLASNDASFVTGTSLAVDGGYLAI
ncbi:MAG: SDR family oxidoreductase [Hyphomicrobiales bacterium]|nr:SDR family oxidoreductase [Hyphomicrobiales bacterium]